MRGHNTIISYKQVKNFIHKEFTDYYHIIPLTERFVDSFDDGALGFESQINQMFVFGINKFSRLLW